MSLIRSYDPFEGNQIIEDESNLVDEMDQIVREQNHRLITPDGKVASELGGMVGARELAHGLQQFNDQVQNVFINPISARKGVLGGSAKMVNGAPPQNLINWNADKMEETTVVTISLALIEQSPDGGFNTGGIPVFDGTNLNSPSPNPGAQNRPYANVYWVGGRGVPQVAQVDIGRGCQFSIAGSMVKVDVGLDVGNTAGVINLGAWLSFFSAYRTSPVTRTIYVDSLAAFAAQAFLVPPFAKRLLPVIGMLSGQTLDAAVPLAIAFQLDFVDINGTGIARMYGGGAGSGPWSIAPMALPCDAYAFSVTNKDTRVQPSSLTTRLMFELGI